MLEFDQVCVKLAEYAAFSLSAELARSIKPTNNLHEARVLLSTTTESRYLLSLNEDIGIGGARDIRALVDLARKSGILEPGEIIEIQNTLISSRDLQRAFNKHIDEHPNLAKISANLNPPEGLIDAISKVLSDRGEILDQASPKLAATRKEIKVCRSRLVDRLQKVITNSKYIPLLQEQIITQRNDRYVIPLKAEFKGRIKGIIHDQSSSGATLFIEPEHIVAVNNELQALYVSEKNEVQRILAELSEQIGREADPIITLILSLAQFDLALMRAKYADDLDAVEPILEPFNPSSSNHPGGVIYLKKAKHPLIHPERVVPIDVTLENDLFALVITGPNTGGKTVTLKTIGLLVLMAQSGLHIPAQSGSKLSLFNDVFADIGDEQSIEQSLSTFSGHITNIVRIIKLCNNRSLIILDELGAGTDPQEGATLARAILSHFVGTPITCFIATHYPELKIFAHATPGVVNASLEFDPQTFSPTYRLTIGLPGRSNALQIAKRLGLPDDILAEAKRGINPEDLRAEDLLDDIHKQRERAFKEYESAKLERLEAEKLRTDYENRLAEIESERIIILDNAQATAEDTIEDIKDEVKEIRKALRHAKKPADELKTVDSKIKRIDKKVKAKQKSILDNENHANPLSVGNKVELRKLGLSGKIVGLENDEVEVLAGSLRIKVHINDIIRPRPDISPKQEPSNKNKINDKKPSTPTLIHASPGIEINLRGKLVDEALDALEKHIENAYLADVPSIRIIHGKGTGRLRQAVHLFLKHSEYMANWKTADENEGGTGATIAYLKNN